MRFIRAPKKAPPGAVKTAKAADVRFGQTFADDTGFVTTGSMPDRSGADQTVTASTPVEAKIRLPVPNGYYPANAGVAANEPDFLPNNIRKGKTIAGTVGTLNVSPAGGLDTSDATATAANILAPKSAYVNAEKLTGTMPDRAAAVLVPSGTGPVTIPAGYHNGAGAVQQVIVPADKVMAGTTIAGVAGTLQQGSSGTATATPGTVSGDLNISGFPAGYYGTGATLTVHDDNYNPATVKAGASIFGKAGTFTGDATAQAGNILTDLTAYANGAKVTGTMPNNTNTTIAPSATASIGIPVGYHDGTTKVGQVNVPAANVKVGTTIAGVAGTMPDNGAVTITPGAANKPIPAGYHSGGTVVGDPDLVSGNIRAGTNIFGVPGSGAVVDTTSYYGDPSWILAGATFWGGGAQFSGTMPKKSGWTGTVGWGNSNADNTVDVNLPYGYYEGGYQVSIADGNLTSGNIRAGVSIFGVTGNLSGKASGSTGCTVVNYAGNYVNYVYVQGLGFTPSTVVAWQGGFTAYNAIVSSFMSSRPAPGIGRVVMFDGNAGAAYMTGVDGPGGYPYAEMGAGYFMIPMGFQAGNATNAGAMNWIAYE